MTNINSYGGGQNTYNPLKNKGRNKKIITIIIFLVLIVIGFSFALFSPSINLLGRRNIKISKYELDINFKESDELMLVSKYPISTRQALEGGYKPKTVTITNNSTCDMAYYKLTIKDLINSSINKDVIQYHVVDKQNTMTYKLGDVNEDNDVGTKDRVIISRYVNNASTTFSNNKIKAGDVNGDGKITSEDYDLISSYINGSITTFPAGTPLEEKTTTKEIIDVNSDTFLIENSLEKGQTHEYEIMMWISNAATNNDLYVNGDTTKPIEYKYALNIEVTDKKEDAEIVPILNIPVGTNGIEKITHEIDDTLQVDNRFATEYRYRGGNVNNYVTFNNETWRIIGVIPTEDTDGNVENRIKIIRNESIGVHSWNDCSFDNSTGKCTENDKYLNDWTGSTLNTYLNNDYYNTLEEESKDMTETTKYYLGGYNASSITTNVMWQYERKNEENRTGYYYDTNPIIQSDASKKMAIMYASDYGYAASKECTSNLGNYSSDTNCKTTNNWLDGNLEDWTIVQISANERLIFRHYSNGLTFHPQFDNHARGSAIRPVLSLSSNVKISGGSGTSSDPYQLQLN